MSSRLSFFRRSYNLFLLLCLSVVSSCARKNAHVYVFDPPQRVLVHRVDLPYLAHVCGTYDAVQHQFNITWIPIVGSALPYGLSLYAYNVYVGTSLKFFRREPLLQIPAQAHVCVIAAQQQVSSGGFFSVAPVFRDLKNNEFVGLVTVVKF